MLIYWYLYIAQETVDPKYWSAHAQVFFDAVKNDIDKSVAFVGRGGTRRLNGTYPQKYAGLVSPSSDILSYCSNSANDTDFVCRPTAKRKRNERHRCRRCGNCYAEPEWKPFHVNKISSTDNNPRGNREGKYLRNGKDNKVWENCTVNESDFEEGFKDFPFWDTKKRLPPRKNDNAA